MILNLRLSRSALAIAAGAMFVALITGEALIEGGMTMVNLIFETVMLALIVGTSVATALLFTRVEDQERRDVELRREIAGVRSSNAAWREQSAAQVRELGRAIQRQLSDWGLTPAEQEIGLLLLKGFSHKEIARLRRTSEMTVRQQATAVYQKSGLGGRAELSAFFLDDLLVLEQAPPPSERDAPPIRPGLRNGGEARSRPT
jgi:DNA-binding CsgD family transcriptional regulator